MAKAKIHRDKYGLFVKHDGQVWRPQINTRYFPKVGEHRGRSDKVTAYQQGDLVNVRHPRGVMWAHVGDEFWYSHGYYCKWSPDEGNLTLHSEECWLQ